MNAIRETQGGGPLPEAAARPVIVRAEGLTKQVSTPDHELVIVSGATFEVAAGESVAVVGASGSGKSTLLGLLAGLDVPSSGRVWIDGEDLFAQDEDGRARLRGRLVGFVFQSFQLLPALTALENVMLPLELAGLADASARASGVLGQVGLADRLGHYPRQLSGGEQQRVAVARAFATEPKLLFADEPTGNLDSATGAQVIELLFRMNREHGTTLVLVTHDEALADRCDRRISISAGVVQA
ncbi:MAG TPA: ABC transporter ATP-binding protein [Usitatibacteraceae bacterium]|jgi:putative ABC transport system ATP-binding protein|nr:ABC transporter ATP-binding protein [Usitatibacteraceae bacterium]